MKKIKYILAVVLIVVFSTGVMADYSNKPIIGSWQQIVKFFASGSCTGYLKSDGTCSTEAGSIAANVPIVTNSLTATGGNITGLTTLGTNTLTVSGVANITTLTTNAVRTPMAHGAVGDGVTDDTAAFTTIDTLCGTNYCTIDLVGKSYVATKMTISGNRAIKNGTLIFKTGETGDFLYISAKDNILLDNLIIDGNATPLTFTTGSTVGTRVGVQILGASSNILLNNVTAKNFDKSGVEAANIGDDATYGTGLRIIGGKYINNYYNLHLDTAAQYIQVVGSSIGGGRFGIYDIAGNMTGSALNILHNVDGIYLGTSVNDGHGSISNSKINHQDQYAIITDGVVNGFTFNGSHIYYGDVYLKNSQGIHIINGHLSSVDFLFEGGGYNTVKDNMLGSVACTVTRNYNSSVSQTDFRNNRYMATGLLHASCDISSEATAAKAKLINDIYTIVTPANVKALWFFDKGTSDTTLADASTLGGATAHIATFRNASMASIASSTMTPGFSDVGRYLSIDATHLFNTPDSDDFSFGNGTSDSAFSVVVLARVTGVDGPLLAKTDSTTGSTQAEWLAPYIHGGKLKAYLYDNAGGLAVIGRKSTVDVTTTTPQLFTVTYSGSSSASGIKLYQNSTQIDTTDFTDGSYGAMDNTTSVVGSYSILANGSLYPAVGKYYVVLVVAEELTQVQINRLNYLMRAYAGISSITW